MGPFEMFVFVLIAAVVLLGVWWVVVRLRGG